MSARSAKMKQKQLPVLEAGNPPSVQRTPGTKHSPHEVGTPQEELNLQEEQEFHNKVDAVYEERIPDFSKSINIALIGEVSSGKSSLLNAILERTRDNPAAQVGAVSGVTTKLKCFKLDGDDHVLIIDSPGLSDVIGENSQETERLQYIHLGILVVSGSIDRNQKKHYDELRQKAKKVFVVLNKIDVWDHLQPSAVEDVENQWKAVLGAEKIYRTCAKGYDPEARKDVPIELRGVDELREDIFSFLAAERTDLLLARHLGNKNSYAARIISAALASVAVEAFIPGSAAYIMVTQAVTITSLYYVHTGRVISKRSALAAIPSLLAKEAGMQLFLLAKSFLPPTGIVDAAAAVVAVLVTLVMLATVNAVLAAGADLHEKKMLHDKYDQFDQRAKKAFEGVAMTDLLKVDFLKSLVYKVMFA